MRPVSWIDYHAARTPDRLALVDLHRGVRRTYGELAQRVRAVAWSLETQYNVREGDRVAVLSRNDARVFEVLYACATLGAIAVPLNWRLSETELTTIAADAEPAVLFRESEAPAIPAVPYDLTWDDYENLAESDVPGQWCPPTVTEDDIWTIIYTSGTTGVPKGVQTTHRAALASILGIIVAHEVGPGSRCLTVLPLFHVAGLNLFANPVLYTGGTVYIAKTFEAADALALLNDENVGLTHFCGVPANYQFMEQAPGFADSPLRHFIAAVGGSPVPAALVETWAERGVALTTVFGITEAGACVTAMPPGQELSHNGTIGRPLLYARCRVRTLTDEDAAPGETGELQLAGDLVTSGYWRKPEATDQALTSDGWLRTGDAATLGEDGHLVLVDRWKDMYISGGENVYPAEVENVLHAHSSISQAAVVGAPHPRWGESGIAFVVFKPGATATPDELTNWCREHLAPYKVPTRFMPVTELPRNATGKIVKGRLREQVVDASPTI